MVDPKFKTFALTIRPRDGVTDKHVETAVAWVRTRSDYYHIVTEKDGSARHIHAGIVLKKEVSKSNLGTLLKRLFSDLASDEQKVLLKGVKVMYNEDFIRKYLAKDDNTVVVASNLPEVGHLESYFPPKPIQSDGRTKRCSIYYLELEKLWYEHARPEEEVNTVNARNFLFKMMYSKRLISVIRDDRMIIQTARHLVRFIGKVEDSTIELAPFEKEE